MDTESTSGPFRSAHSKSRRTRWIGGAWAIAWAVITWAPTALSQPLTIPRFDFSFSDPGARSLGFGGAFAALADDATAAYINPAGLVQLTQPEVSLELRLWDRSPSFISGGRVDGEPSGEGLDTVSGVTLGRDSSEELGPSFVSLVIPRGRWSFALYGHQLATFEQFAESQGSFFDDSPPAGAVGRFPATREGVELDVATVGAAAAWRVNDHLSLGLGLVFSDAFLGAISQAFAPDDVGALFDPVTFLPQRLISSSTLEMKGTDLTLNAGLLWRISDRFSSAFFFRQGASVGGISILETGPVIPGDATFFNPATLEIPDVAGLGLAYRSAGGRLTLTSEVDWVGYEGLIVIESPDALLTLSREYRDAWEVHFGAELALIRSDPILAFRVGGWVERNGDDLVGEDFTHLTAGLGWVYRGVQIDLAGDFSEEVDSVSLSLIYTF